MLRMGSVDKVDPLLLVNMEKVSRYAQSVFYDQGYVSITIRRGGKIHCVAEIGDKDDAVQFACLDIESPRKEAVASQC